MHILFAGLTSLFYGVADFFGGFATRKAPAVSVSFMSQAIGFGVLLIAAPLLGGDVTGSDFAWGACAGMSGAMAIVLLYYGLSRYRVGVVAPLAAVTSIVFALLFGVIIGERPTLIAWIGVALAFPAIVLTTAEREGESAGRRETLRAAQLGALAGLGFGLFYILISRAGDDAGLWPLVGARLASLPALAGAALVTRRPLLVPRREAPVTTAAGVLDMGANVFYLLAVQRGPVSLVSVISTLYPAATIAMSRMVLRERVGATQGLGLLLTAVAVSLIALG